LGEASGAGVANDFGAAGDVSGAEVEGAGGAGVVADEDVAVDGESGGRTGERKGTDACDAISDNEVLIDGGSADGVVAAALAEGSGAIVTDEFGA